MNFKQVILSTLKYLSLLLGVVFALLPLVVVFFSSLKTGEEMANTSLLIRPEIGSISGTTSGPSLKETC
ncbi:exported hypothetical protein [[Clostridium] ultunense Esp]|nr:exported hypothetical protein [[Clostridium] ultunense Esp]